MRLILQRVSEASVTVNQVVVGKIKAGWLILLGVCDDDNSTITQQMAAKVLNLRAFSDEQGKMNLDLKSIGGEILLVSQFTLYGDCRKGRRPSFTKAGNPELANNIYIQMAEYFKQQGVKTELGQFGADMKVQLLNDGPVTLILDSDELLNS